MNASSTSATRNGPASASTSAGTSLPVVSATPDDMTPIDYYLRRQQELTAVEQFSQVHDNSPFPAQSRYYSTLMPATSPQKGEQYGFEVDLDACSGCKACVTACHSLNGLDDNEAWRDVGLLHGGTEHAPVMQHVTSACHHCLDPACLNACPVDAYEKDPITGIVKHLDDQCFGCQYCTLACPYDVPKYHHKKGIVRKCDMCSSRLAVGEAPACVQACPNEAIRISIVRKQDVIDNSETNLFLPGAPEPQYTLPTTNYKTKRVLPRNLIPADYYSVKVEHAHWPLIVMLVLTQLSVGAFFVDFLLNSLIGNQLTDAIKPVHSVSALFFGLLAMASSTLHLGRPQYAYRAVIGLRHSWLSREIVAFGAFAPLAAAYSLSVWWSPLAQWGGHTLETGLGAAVVGTGLFGVLCSIMIYQCTRREFWSGTFTTIKFCSTTLLLGIVTALVTSMILPLFSVALTPDSVLDAFGETLCRTLIVVSAAKLLYEASVFRHLGHRQNTPLKRSAMLLVGQLSRATKLRFFAGTLGGIVLPSLLLSSPDVTNPIFAATVALLAFVGCLAGELLERYLFFTAVVAPKMPGGLTS